MAVKLRLRRMGKKRQPIYKVVAADVRSPRDGKFIEDLGQYNPKTNPSTIEIKEDRALYWLSVGAIPTTTVKNLLSVSGILLKSDLAKQNLSPEQIEARVSQWEKEREAKMATLKKQSEAKKGPAQPPKQETKAEEVKEESAPEAKSAEAGTEEKAEEQKSEAPKEETPKEETPKEEAPKEEAKSEEVKDNVSEENPEAKGAASEQQEEDKEKKE